MKAFILAAGYGTRLAPHSQTLPKPLFPIAGKVMLDRLIYQLADAGASAIMVNTHHLHRQIEAHVQAKSYPVRVATCFEPHILGTAGALKNIADFWSKAPLLVINSDIFTDIDLSGVYQFHTQHDSPITMVMHDYPEFNGVSVSTDGFVTDFGKVGDLPKSSMDRKLAYTGIQVVDPCILDMIPNDTFSDIIAIYKTHLNQGGKIAAHIIAQHRWHDIGSPVGIRNAVLNEILPKAFAHLGQNQLPPILKEIHLAGDGSDRKWSRITASGTSVILADHGIVGDKERSETQSFIHIGNHLALKSIRVPKILAADPFSGLVIVEDLGDQHLQAQVSLSGSENCIILLYQKVIDQLIQFSIKGAERFDLKWTYQTERYDKPLILEKECRYFVEAFLNGYLGIDITYDELAQDFEAIAQSTIENAIWGLMHRDCQSRNIMWHNDQCHFIDFQGARIGPIQYDLASLLIDPYVILNRPAQESLENYYEQKLLVSVPEWAGKWQKGYLLCRLTRNLQILGAFGYLTKVKKKSFFAQFIPTALETLRQNLTYPNLKQFTRLSEVVNQIPPIG